VTDPRPSPARRHLRWIIPLAIAVLVYLGAAFAISLLPQDDPEGARLVAGLVGLATLLVVFAALVVALVNGIRTLAQWGRARRIARGRLTPAERLERDRASAHARAWEEAARLRRRLIAREVPATIDVWDVVPNQGEVFFARLEAGYARFYGTQAVATQAGGFFFGHPAFVVAGLAVTAIGNAARRSQAEAAAMAQWREQQPTIVIVSNQRLVCLAAGRWLTFSYDAMTAVYPEVGDWSLICQFASAEPLMLTGIGAPAAAVLTVLMTHGPEALERHPSLHRFDGGPDASVAVATTG